VGRRRSILYRAEIGRSGWIPDLRCDPLGRQGWRRKRLFGCSRAKSPPLLSQPAQPRSAERTGKASSLFELKAGDECIWQAANDAFALCDAKAVDVVFAKLGEEFDDKPGIAPVAAELRILVEIGKMVQQ
jgi:hypothetical protein